jgi:hypothetical protein
MAAAIPVHGASTLTAAIAIPAKTGPSGHGAVAGVSSPVSLAYEKPCFGFCRLSFTRMFGLRREA